MSDIFDFLRRTYVERTPHMVEAGMQITSIERARGTMTLPAREQWIGDPVRGLLHPGPIIVLADSCCGLAVGAALDTDLTYATLDLRMDYLRAAVPDQDVHCEAHCYRVSRSVAFIRAEVWQDDRTQPIASTQSAFMLATPSGSRPTTVKQGEVAPAPEAFNSAASAMLSGLSSSGRDPSASPELQASGWQPPAASLAPQIDRPIPYAEYLQIRVAPDPMQPVFRLPFDPKLIGNPFLPALHGGVVAGFAETAAILHLYQTLGGSKLPKSIDFSMDYLRVGRPEETFAACEVVRVGARVALVTVRIWQRSPDYPIGVARAHFLLAALD